MEFALLDASHLGTPTRRNFRRELDAELTAFDVKGGDLPPTHDYDGAVITGSRSSVNDDEAWIDDLEAWVREALDRDVPVLGVCFGQQVLVDALGGEVESMGTYELGYHQVHRTGDSRLLDGADEWFVAFTAHSDEVTELPPDAEKLAENNFSIHAFRRGAAFGVQFHPDFDLDTAKAAMEYKDADDEQISRVLDQVREGADRQVADSKRVFENFEAFARDRARDAAVAPAGE